MNNDAANVKKSTGPLVLTLRLRLPVLLTALVLLAVGMVWIFMAGVLVGRGYSTEEDLGVLASFMPTPQVAESTGAAASDRPDAGVSGSSADSGESSGPTASGTEAGIDGLFAEDSLLRGEDLAFKDTLSAPLEMPPLAGQTGAGTSAAQSGAQISGVQSANTAGQPDTTASTATQAGTTAQINDSRPGNAAGQANGGNRPNATAPGSRQGQPDASDQAVYEYIYQVSSFSQQHQAQLLIQRLQDAGINAQIELHRAEAGTWYRVLVNFKGRSSELEAFNAKLAPFNLGTPMLRKRVMISR